VAEALKRLVITREPSSDEGTFGRGVLDGDLAWDFIELPWRNNAPSSSCIPVGVYRASVIISPHFQRPVYLFANVPGRDAIEMHPANWAGDTSKGFWSDLRGCCAPGTARGRLYTRTGKLQAAVLHSAHALDQLLEATACEPIDIEFKWRETT